MQGERALAGADALVGTPVPPGCLGQAFQVIGVQALPLVGRLEELVGVSPRVAAHRFPSASESIVEIHLPHGCRRLDGAHIVP